MVDLVGGAVVDGWLTSAHAKLVFEASQMHEVESFDENDVAYNQYEVCLLYTSPSPRDGLLSRMPSSA